MIKLAVKAAVSYAAESPTTFFIFVAPNGGRLCGEKRVVGENTNNGVKIKQALCGVTSYGTFIIFKKRKIYY